MPPTRRAYLWCLLALLTGLTAACQGWDDDTEFIPQYRGTALWVQDSTGNNRVDYWAASGYRSNILAPYAQGSLGGVYLVPQAGLLYASDPTGRQLIIYNLRAQTLLQRLPLDAAPGPITLCSQHLAIALQDRPAVLWLDIRHVLEGSDNPRVYASYLSESPLPAFATQLLGRSSTLYAADGLRVWVLSETARTIRDTIRLEAPALRLQLDAQLRLIVLTPNGSGCRYYRFEPNGHTLISTQAFPFQDARISPYAQRRWGQEYLGSVERNGSALNQPGLPFPVGSFGVDFQGGWAYAAGDTALVRYNLNTKRPDTVLNISTVRALQLLDAQPYYDAKR